MTASDSLPYDDSRDEAGGGPAAEGPPSTPRWVKVSGAIALVVVVLVGLMLLVGGGPGGHGPGRHTGSGDAGRTPASNVTQSGGAAGHTPPAGGHAP